jgi:hypothetical protein
MKFALWFDSRHCCGAAVAAAASFVSCGGPRLFFAIFWGGRLGLHYHI